jgi:hypothetical protein
VLIPVERLVRRQVASRAAELVELRRRLRSPETRRASDEERALAHEIRGLKQQITDVFGTVSSCAGCAVGETRPNTFPGGDCCGGVTPDLFSDEEVAALALAGTRPRHLRAPRTEHAGCAFRAIDGCTLAPVDRPERCIHFTCGILRRELHDLGRLDAIDGLREQLKQRMVRFVAARAERLDDELFATLETAVLRAARGTAHH